MSSCLAQLSFPKGSPEICRQIMFTLQRRPNFDVCPYWETLSLFGWCHKSFSGMNYSWEAQNVLPALKCHYWAKWVGELHKKEADTYYAGIGCKKYVQRDTGNGAKDEWKIKICSMQTSANYIAHCLRLIYVAVGQPAPINNSSLLKQFLK